MNIEIITFLILILLFGMMIFGYNIYQLVKNIDRNLKESMKAHNHNYKTLDEKLDKIDHKSRTIISDIRDTKKLLVDDDYLIKRKERLEDSKQYE